MIFPSLRSGLAKLIRVRRGNIGFLHQKNRVAETRARLVEGKGFNFCIKVSILFNKNDFKYLEGIPTYLRGGTSDKILLGVCTVIGLAGVAQVIRGYYNMSHGQGKIE